MQRIQLSSARRIRDAVRSVALYNQMNHLLCKFNPPALTLTPAARTATSVARADCPASACAQVQYDDSAKPAQLEHHHRQACEASHRCWLLPGCQQCHPVAGGHPAARRVCAAVWEPRAVLTLIARVGCAGVCRYHRDHAFPAVVAPGRPRGKACIMVLPQEANKYSKVWRLVESKEGNVRNYALGNPCR